MRYSIAVPLQDKNKIPAMQTARLVQAVILMMVVAMAASCAATKEYTSKLFTPRVPVVTQKDSSEVALRFLELDQLDGDPANWVTTDIIKGKDTTSGSYQLDKLAKTLPATADSTLLPKTETKTTETLPVARQINT